MPSEKASPSQIEEAKNRARALKVPFKDLAGQEVPAEVLKEIPEEAASFYRFIPMAKVGSVLEVGMVNPTDLKAKEALRFIALRNELTPKIFLITEADLEGVLRRYRSLHGEVNKALAELEGELDVGKTGKSKKARAKEIAKRITADAPVTKIVAVMLRHATEGKASDIHIEPLENQLKIRFRVDGILHTSLFLPKEVHSAVVSRIKILSNLKIDESRIPQDGRFRTAIDNKTIDFRVSTLPTTFGEKVVLRVLDSSVGLRSFEDLGLFGYNLRVLKKATKRPFGMILMTGPTGSGKTTTLYAILNTLDKDGTNIVSLEDPIEYFIEGVNQSQIRPEIKYTFASGLRHILRQDPDVVMVGEIRDEETADLSVHTALTGHVVLSTLHTNNAVGVIPRLVDMGISPFLLPSALSLSAAQRLVRRLCNQCKKPVEASAKISEIIDQQVGQMSEDDIKELKITKPYQVYRAEGCKYCANKGTKGRIAIYEMFEMTPQLEEIIVQGATSEARLEEEAKRQGMITMRQDGIVKVLQGIISFEEMLKATKE